MLQATAPRASCFAEDPDRPAPDADIFWDAAHDPSVIIAAAEGTCRSDREAFDLLAQRVPAAILQHRGRPDEVRLGIGGRAIRLCIVSGTLLEGPVRLSFQVDGSRQLSIRLRALRAFDSYMRNGRIPLLPTPFTPSPRRMAMLLATMDGVARGWSQRRIAVALFGEKTVAADWNGRSDFLKSRVRRLIAWAETLGGDAYLGLLQR